MKNLIIGIGLSTLSMALNAQSDFFPERAIPLTKDDALQVCYTYQDCTTDKDGNQKCTSHKVCVGTRGIERDVSLPGSSLPAPLVLPSTNPFSR